MTVVEQTVQHGRDQNRIFKDFRPCREILVGGDDHGPFFIGLADQPEQEMALLAVDL